MTKPKQPSHNPGGKVRLIVPSHIQSTAVFGGQGDCYRYQLIRTWDATKPHAMFVMMNPSTADPLVDDPTVAKCGRLARAWNYGGIYVGNTFAYRATDQIRLTEISDPIGPDNDHHLMQMAQSAGIVIFAYGQPRHPTLRSRGLSLARLLIEKGKITPHILRLSNNGTPWHPLYLPESLKPVPWQIEPDPGKTPPQ